MLNTLEAISLAFVSLVIASFSIIVYTQYRKIEPVRLDLRILILSPIFPLLLLPRV
jgi:hypothetical protein